VKKTYTDASKAAAVKAFVTYGLTTGQAIASQLGYITLPANVVTQVQIALATVK
jgi:phosphate transport system substrate-binding protein